MSTFDTVSKQYANKSLVQQKAAGRLIELLKISKGDKILDVACGPGNITDILSKISGAPVVGTDISKAMIEQARKSNPGIEFINIAAEDLNYSNEFDVVFTNSSFQWFTNPDKAAKAMFSALKPGGRIGVSCPATKDWSPAFQSAVQRVSESPLIKPVFQHWKNPWFMFHEINDYKKFFEQQGLKTIYANVEYEPRWFSVNDAFGVYLAGAANGFVGRQYYDVEIKDDYISRFNDMIRAEFVRASKNEKVLIDFNRLYYIGKK